MKANIGWNSIEKALVIFLLLASVGAAVDYPQFFQGKFCYDETGTLANDQWTALNQRLLDYQARTTNEVLIVITQSLQGQELSDYAKGLFNKWAIGRFDVNNGVLIVVHRATFNGEESDEIVIQRGDGVADYINEDDFYNEVADSLWEGDERNWYNGLEAGLNYLEENLPGSWPGAVATAEERSSPPYQPAASPQSGDGGNGSTIIVVLIIVVSSTLLFLLARAVMSSRAEAKREAEREAERKIQAAADYQKESLDMIPRLRDLLTKLEASLVPAQTALNGLKAGHPESVWKTLVEPFEEINVSLLNTLKLEIDVAEGDVKENKNPEAARNAIRALARQLMGYIQVCNRLVDRLKLADQSKGEAQSALEYLPGRIEGAKQEAAHPDVGDEARGIINAIEQRFPLARALKDEGQKEIDWIQTNAAFKAMSEDIAWALFKARSDKEQAQKARTEGPKLLAKLPEIEEALAKKETEYKDSNSAQAAIAATRADIAKVREVSANTDSMDWMRVYLLMQTVESRHSEADHAFHHHNLRIAEKKEEERRLAAKRRERRSDGGDLHGGRSATPSRSRTIGSSRPSTGTTGGGRSTTTSHGRKM
jgi:uncharacterized membrane protein YgcG